MKRSEFTTMHHKAKLSQWITKEKYFPSWRVRADADAHQRRRVPSSELTRPSRQFRVSIVRIALACTVHFCNAITFFPVKWRLRNERRNSILMMCHYPNLGGASDWSRHVRNLIQPIRSTSQTRVVTLHQYEISALVSQTSFRGKTSGCDAKCGLFCQATSSETCHFILSGRTKRYMYKQFWCLLSDTTFIFILQIKTVDLSNSADCLSKFKSSKWLGLLLFAGIVGGTVLKESSNSENEERKA